MIRVQPSSAHRERLLIGSDLNDPIAARREVQDYITRNAYRVPKEARLLSVFDHGEFVREWVLVESEPTPTRHTPFTRLMRRTFSPDKAA